MRTGCLQTLKYAFLPEGQPIRDLSAVGPDIDVLIVSAHEMVPLSGASANSEVPPQPKEQPKLSVAVSNRLNIQKIKSMNQSALSYNDQRSSLDDEANHSTLGQSPLLKPLLNTSIEIKSSDV